jgi:hypothetical protein
MSDSKDSTFTLKKVKITLNGGGEAEFIFGIGPQGLTPFEYELSMHKVGDKFDLCITGGELKETFGHLVDMLPLPEYIEAGAVLRVTIESLQDAQPREVIRAMAELARCEDHCCSC